MKNIKIIVPLSDNNKADNRVQVGINGRFWDIAKGVEVAVPENVAELLEAAGYNPSYKGSAEHTGGKKVVQASNE